MSFLCKFVPRSIHGKFLFFLLGLTVVPVIIGLTALEWTRYENSYNKLLTKLYNQTASQSLLLAEPLWNKNIEQIYLNSATLIADPDVLAVRIFNTSHQLVYSYGNMPEDKSPLFRKHDISYVNRNIVEKLGSIELFLTDENITSSTKQRLYERGLMLLIFLCIVISAFLTLQLTVGRGLKSLLYSINQADKEGTLVPVKWHSDDELGQVVKAFNAMQVRQRQHATELQQAYDTLERRVAERTESLSKEILRRKTTELELRKQDQELQTFLNGVPVMLWMLEPNGKTMRFNNSWLAFSGLTQAEEEQMEWKADDIHPKFRETCIHTYNSSIENRSPFTMEYLRQNGQHEYRWISEIGMPRFGSDGVYLGYFGTCTDITSRKKAEELLFAEKERAQVTLSSIGEGVITTDAKGIVLFINPMAEKLTGVDNQNAEGRSLSAVFNICDEQTRKPLSNPAELCIQRQKVIGHKDSTLLISGDGREYYIKDSTAPIFDQQRELIGTVLVFVDITESKRLAQQLTYQASHDPLTGLINRREFERILQIILQTTQERNAEHALFFMDLDQFKIINDTCGHVAGDELLRQLTGVLKHKLRKSDTLARLGGDEFGVLMEYCNLQEATLVGEELCKLVEQFRFYWEGKSFTLGVSIGLVTIGGHAISLEQLMIDADSACYAAKNSGRGRVHIYQADDVELAKQFGEMQWTTKITQALDEDLFRLYWQPIFSFEENANTHCELLIRMIGKEGQVVSPTSFLPAAERYNMAISIDQWVINKAFSWIALLSTEKQTIRQFGINLSGQSLSDVKCMEYIIGQLDYYGVAAKKICFEITETAVIENLSVAINSINRLKTLGCQFALDDFGSGLSSYAYLKQLPVDYLKIDGFFIQEMADDPIDLEMVHSINKIGQVMGKRTIAEFVENEETLQKLRDMGVNYAQGYHLGRPLPIEEF